MIKKIDNQEITESGNRIRSIDDSGVESQNVEEWKKIKSTWDPNHIFTNEV